MPFFEVEPGVKIAYQDRGAGRPIVFVHGWGGSGEVWDAQVLDLAGRFRCITVDLHGHGDSDKPWGRYDYPMFCRDLQALMTGLELDDVTLVGWSMGGHIGLKYAHTIGTPVTRHGPGVVPAWDVLFVLGRGRGWSCGTSATSDDLSGAYARRSSQESRSCRHLPRSALLLTTSPIWPCGKPNSR